MGSHAPQVQATSGSPVPTHHSPISAPAQSAPMTGTTQAPVVAAATPHRQQHRQSPSPAPHQSRDSRSARDVSRPRNVTMSPVRSQSRGALASPVRSRPVTTSNSTTAPISMRGSMGPSHGRGSNSTPRQVTTHVSKVHQGHSISAPTHPSSPSMISRCATAGGTSSTELPRSGSHFPLSGRDHAAAPTNGGA